MLGTHKFTKIYLCCWIFIFYCVNTSYPMDNCFTGRRDRSRQTPEKDVLYRIPAGPVRRVHLPGGASYFLFLSRHRDVIASFSFGAWRVKTCFQRQGISRFITNSTAFFISKKFGRIIYNYVISRTETRFMRTRYGWV